MKLPLFIVTGTSGAGKTTIIPFLREILPEYIVFDGDSVVVENDYNISKCNWLRIANSIAQSGRRTILCSTIVPENLYECSETGCFSNIYYINLMITDEQIRERLTNRGWNNDLIENYVDFSGWLKNNAETAFNPPMFTVDARKITPQEVAELVATYIESK